MVCGNFILPEPASYVFFYAFFNLRNLLYIISVLGYSAFGIIKIFIFSFKNIFDICIFFQAVIKKHSWRSPKIIFGGNFIHESIKYVDLLNYPTYVSLSLV